MRSFHIPSLAAAGLFASGCGAPADPQLAMCQTLAKNLTGDNVASFDDADQRDSSRARSVKIAFETHDGQSGSIDCRYPINQTTGIVDTAPKDVALDGQMVPMKELFAAGIKASGEIISGVATETAAQTKEYAEEATDQAKDLAGKARDAALEGGKALQQAIEQ